MTTSTRRRRFTRVTALAAAIALASAMHGFAPASAGAAGLLEPTTTHNVMPQEKSFPDDRACPEGATLQKDQFQSLTQGVEATTVSKDYDVGGVIVTVKLTVNADNSFDFQIVNGIAAQVFVKGGQESGYLLYQYDPPVAGATNSGPVNHDTGLHDGYVSGDSYQDVSHLDFCLIPVQLVALDVATTATASFNRTISWSLDKSVAPASHSGTAGENAGSSTWTVVATKTVTLGGFAVTGTVTVANDNDVAVPFTIALTLDDSTGVTVDCPSLSVSANDSVICTFTATPTAAAATEVTAVVTPSTAGLDPVTATADVSFVPNAIGDDTVTADDDRDTEDQFPAVISSSTTFAYDETFPCSSNAADYTNGVDIDTYPNTATLTGDNTDLSDDAEVTVTCSLAPAPAPASVDVTKTVAGNTAAWSFDFTIAPVPAGETATKSATNSAPTVGWDGLVPGTTYTITETNVAGFVTGILTCTGGTNGSGTSTFTPAPGQAVICAITNDVVEQQAPPIADIAVVKTATPAVVTPGGNVTWTLTATNNGPDAADNASIVDNLPASLTLVSFTSPAGWDCSGTVTGNPGKLSCTKPTMGVNESATFTLSTTVAASAAGQTINNTAVVSTSTNETTTANNQDPEPISVQVAVLPPTGNEVWNRLAIAAMFVLAGFAMVAIDRRRRIIS